MVDEQPHAYWVILATFFAALVLALLPLPRWLLTARPEWVALVLIYWCLALPSRVGLITALCLGIMLDVLEGALLGQNALALVTVSLLVLTLYQRVRVFSLWQQAAVVFVLIGIYQMICQWVQNLEGLGSATMVFMLPALTSSLLWPLVLLGLRSLRRSYRVS